MEKQPFFAITSQKLVLQTDKRGGEGAPSMELLPPDSSPGPWEVLSWKYDPQASGKIHVVWRHG
jgi:hypothetical protein